MKNILFICVENSNRSQMAQAFATMYGDAQLHSYSAGSKPSGKVNEKAIQSMKKIGYDLSVHLSKAVSDLPEFHFDYVIGMGCGDDCPLVATNHRLEWDIPDPKHLEGEAFDQVRDLIASHVKDLLLSMQAHK